MATHDVLTRKRAPKPKYNGKKMPLERFMDFKPEDGFKYEWNNGFLEAREKMIKPSELYILKNLLQAFQATSSFEEGDMLFTETVCPVSEGKYRIPDISFLTKAQIDEAREGKPPVASFLIELVSESDKVSYYDQKLEEYFSAGVQCVWLISPIHKKVSIFTSPKDVRICTDDDRCSASPAIEDFQLSVNQIFQS
ncbi:MAG: Uma2 family endonuclease [Chloroherpetonaceae bacterium]